MLIVLLLLVNFSPQQQALATLLEEARVSRALDMDNQLAKFLSHHLRAVDNYISTVNEYLEEHRRLTEDGDDEDRVVENPLMAFQVIRRLVINRKQISSQMGEIVEDVQQQLLKIAGEEDQVMAENLLQATKSIFKLQDTYLLPAADLVQGKIDGVQVTTALTIHDCMFLAQTGEELSRVDLLVEWLEQALAQCRLQIAFADQFCRYANNSYRSAAKYHDLLREKVNAKETLDESEASSVLLPDAVSSLAPHRQRMRMIQDQEFPVDKQLNTLCHKGNQLEDQQLATLKCYYLKRLEDMYVTLQRYKVEVRWMKPFIVTIYDTVTSTERALLKRLKKDFTRDDKRFAKKLTQRLAVITGLTIKSSDFELLKFGIGQATTAELDFVQAVKSPPKNVAKDGADRLASLHIYLDEVEKGGATVFPIAQVAVPVIKGAATLWFNMDEKGYLEFATLHYHCPVLYGLKWVAVKRIYIQDQTHSKKYPTIHKQQLIF